MEGLLGAEPTVRLGAFAAVFVAVAAWEALVPRRQRAVARGWRWVNNLGLLVTASLLVRLLVPLGAVAAALVAAERGWGLLHAVALPAGVAIGLSIVLLDLAIWAQHRLFHAVPLLWRLHRVHHADLDCDVTTGLRFHPLEILLSMLIKLGVIVAIGAPAVAVLAFEVVLNATSMFNHANARLSPPLDRLLRLLIVTPDMHRVHHSWHREETDANFGFNLSWWDRLCGTYRARPRDGHEGMTIGLHEFRDPRELRLDRMLAQPFMAAAPDNRGAAGRNRE